jgi:CubicO group peptidase (beta-lactamase class C family)
MKKPFEFSSAILKPILVILGALFISQGQLLKVSYAAQSRSCLPDTIVGRQFGKWLEAYNSGDLERNRKFGIESWDQESLKWIKPEDFLTNTFLHTRGVDIVRVTDSSDFRIVVIARARLLGDYWNINAVVSPQLPHGLTVNGMFQEPPPADLVSHTRVSDNQIIKRFVNDLHRFVAADEFSGTILIAKNGRKKFLGAYGWANRDQEVANKENTKFWLASISKLFTGIAVVQLAERGKLSLRAPIIKYLPDYPNKSVAEKVTIHHLLTHTSGMGEFQFKKEYQEAPDKFRRPKEIIPLFANDPLEFEPGERSSYSNAGVIVLGAIVERVSGQRFTDYVSANIFKPAGMTNSGYKEDEMEVPGLATPYQNVGWTAKVPISLNESPVERKAVVTKRGVPAPIGGAYSTVEDLLKFELALRRHKLLSGSYVDMVLTGKGELGKAGTVSCDEAYLFQHEGENGKRIVGHVGGYTGMSSQFNIYLDQGYTVIALSNYENQAANVPLAGLRQLIIQGQKTPRGRRVVPALHFLLPQIK